MPTKDTRSAAPAATLTKQQRAFYAGLVLAVDNVVDEICEYVDDQLRRAKATKQRRNRVRRALQLRVRAAYTRGMDNACAMSDDEVLAAVSARIFDDETGGQS